MEISRTASQVRAADTVWNGRRWVTVQRASRAGRQVVLHLATGWVAYAADKTFRVAV